MGKRRGSERVRSCRRRAGRALVIAAMSAALFQIGGSVATAQPLMGRSTTATGGVTRVWTHGRWVSVDPTARMGVLHTPEWLAAHPVASSATNNIPYQGGLIMSGSPRVYLVYWGSQWGTQGSSGGYFTYSGDPSGMAPVQQAFFAGLGTNSEAWSGVMTQYCEGVSMNATSCPSATLHVGYPTGGTVLAGVWEDTSTSAPAAATKAQLAAEAVVAATHFGNTTTSSNANAQYVIVSPTGTNPDHYKAGGFCSWHSGTSSVDGQVAFTNMPYIPDAGTTCYKDAVNSTTGTLDGVTIVGGHEYAETITDPFAPQAWIDPSDSVASGGTGGENGDKCAIGLGYPGGNVTFTTGTFAVQKTWSNDANGGSGGCLLTHATVVGSGPPYPVSLVQALGGYYKVSKGYKLYHHGAKVFDTAASSPNLSGDQLKVTWQQNRSGSWHTLVNQPFPVAPDGTVGISLKTKPLPIGSKYRLHWSFAGDSNFNKATSSWAYFEVTS